MSMAMGSKLTLTPGSWVETLYEVAIGLVVGARHFPNLLIRWWSHHVWNSPNKENNNSTDSTTIHRHQEQKEPAGLKVVAVGYGRTGTYSLALALEELGYPTLHTQHLYEHWDIMSMWAHSVFRPSLQARVARLHTPDLDLIARKFQATTDLPMALYYEQVLAKYPDCQFILTERDSPEIWFRSWNTLAESITETAYLGGFLFTNVRRYDQYLRWIFSIVNQDDKYLQASFPLPPQQKSAAIDSYLRHNQRVREVIPAEQLLVYNVQQGWEPLCDFLSIAPSHCPTDTPFPRTNSARSVKVQAVSGLMTPIIVVFLLLYAVYKLFQRAMGMKGVRRHYWSSLSSFPACLQARIHLKSS